MLFDPIACLEGAVGLVRDQYRLDGIEVRAILPNRTSPVRGQPIRLEQVVLNLLANARDAISARARLDAGGIPEPVRGWIAVSAFVSDSGSADSNGRKSGEVVLTVSDSGGGIPPKTPTGVFPHSSTPKIPEDRR